MIDPASVPVAALHRLIGATPITKDRARFCVWAPTMQQVWVELADSKRRVVMERLESGYHLAEIDGVSPGDLYHYVPMGANSGHGNARPDPASRFQPQGVHGPSMVVDHEYPWTDQDWNPVGRDELVIYELHLGTFTEEGTFSGAIARLDELVDLGVTAIEFMPLADAAGRWNWGYDGVHLFAPNRNYGTPDELRQLIDAAHGKGLSVFLDVVYNHLGPEGNYLGEFGPYLSERHHTVWGAAPNFDDPVYGTELRRFYIANAIHWLDAYHFDGLRLDAIHCMLDESEPHVVAQLSQSVRSWSAESGRRVVLIAESNVYDPEMLAPFDEGGMGFDAEWCDDFLHSVFAVAGTGEQLCHRQYQPGVDLDQTLRFGYVYEGTLRRQRGRRQPTERVETTGLVYSIQHHDFIGNHPVGRRLHQVTSLEFQRAAAALMILSPAIPMLFMGEEFACEHPFQFFVDFNDESLRQAVVEGRKREYPQHDWSAGTLPIDWNAFHGSKIGRADQGNSQMRTWYRQLLRMRRTWRAVGLLSDVNHSVESDPEIGLWCLRYQSENTLATVAVRLSGKDSSAGSVCLSRYMNESQLGDLVLDSHAPGSSTSELQVNHAKIFIRKCQADS